MTTPTTEQPITTIGYRNEPVANATTDPPCNLTFPPNYPPKLADVLCKKSQDYLNADELDLDDTYDGDEPGGNGNGMGDGNKASDNFEVDDGDGGGGGGQGQGGIHK